MYSWLALLVTLQWLMRNAGSNNGGCSGGATEGLAEGDRAAVVVKDGTVEHVVEGGFPFFPGLLPGGLGPLDGGFDDGRPFPRPFRDGHRFPFDCPCEEPAPEQQEASPEL